jgi:G:T-mismatch repair DNA endonuclease (very short patch repair protein)
MKRYNAKRDANEKRIVKELRALGFAVMLHDSKGRPGEPDLIVAKHGHTVLVEVKDKGGIISEAQKTFITYWCDYGEIIVARDTEDVLRAFGLGA